MKNLFLSFVFAAGFAWCLPQVSGTAQAHDFNACTDKYLATDAINQASGLHLRSNPVSTPSYGGVQCSWNNGAFTIIFGHYSHFMPKETLTYVRPLGTTCTQSAVVGGQTVKILGGNCDQVQKVMAYIEAKAKEW